MCGIIGIIGREAAAPQLIDALKRLEYRGYDSAGVATLESGKLTRRRAEGKLKNLESRLAREPLTGTIGIGHTRWATHGRPTENNAHPHATEKVAVVHNGIIENFAELRRELEQEGVKFSTDTDTEVIAHLVTEEMKHGASPVAAVQAALPRLRGAFALAFLFAGEDNLLVGARKGSPLAVGFGDGAMYVGSDAIALAPFTDRVSYLEDGDWVIVTRSNAEIHDSDGKLAQRAEIKSQASTLLIDKGNHRHFMAKEIHEQPEVVGHTLANYLDMASPRIDLSLRHCLLRRHGRTLLVRAVRASAGRGRYRLRIPLPRCAARTRQSRHLRVAIGRDRRHARFAALRTRPQTARALGRQRADVEHRARERGGDAYACRAGNRRGLDQSFYLPIGGSRLSRHCSGTRPRRVEREGREDAGASADRGAAPHERSLGARTATRAIGARARQIARRALSRPRHELSDRARRRAQAEGDFLSSCGGLCGGRTQARADCARR